MKVAFISDANPQPMHIDWVNNFDIESSYGNDMVPGVELAKYSSVYVKDMSSGEVKLVNTSDNGQPSNDNGYGTQISMSADGNLVAFTSGASNLTNDQTNGNANVYVKNLKTGEVILASSSKEGVPADSYSGITSDSLS